MLQNLSRMLSEDLMYVSSIIKSLTVLLSYCSLMRKNVSLKCAGQFLSLLLQAVHQLYICRQECFIDNKLRYILVITTELVLNFLNSAFID